MTFSYEAARADGAVVHGRVDAGSQSEAAALLSSRGLFPIAVDLPSRADAIGRQPSARSLATVFQGLSALVDTGVPLHTALRVTRGLAAAGLRDALERVESRVRNGSSLGAALACEGRLFPAVAIRLVRAGEQGVGLGAALGHAARNLERTAEVTGRIRAALAYPVLLVVVGSASIALIVLFVLPRFAALLTDLGQSLPVSTRILMVSATLLRNYGVVLGALVVAGLAIGYKVLAEQRTVWHRWLLELMVIGPLRHGLATARVARTLSSLLATGTPALAALNIARAASGDMAVGERLQIAHSEVAQGTSLTKALSHARALTPSALELAE